MQKGDRGRPGPEYRRPCGLPYFHHIGHGGNTFSTNRPTVVSNCRPALPVIRGASEPAPQVGERPWTASEKETETEKIDFAVVFLSILSNIMKTYDIKNINYSVLNIKEIQKKIKNKFKIDINFIEKSIIYLIQNNVVGLQGDVIYIKNRFPEYYNLIQNFKTDTIEANECIDYKKSFRILK